MPISQFDFILPVTVLGAFPFSVLLICGVTSSSNNQVVVCMKQLGCINSWHTYFFFFCFVCSLVTINFQIGQNLAQCDILPFFEFFKDLYLVQYWVVFYVKFNKLHNPLGVCVCYPLFIISIINFCIILCIKATLTMATR